MSAHFYPSQGTSSNTIDDNDFVSGLLRRNNLFLFKEPYLGSPQPARYVISSPDNQVLGYFVPDYSNRRRNGMTSSCYQLQDTLGRLLLVINTHMSGTTFVTIPSHDHTGNMRYLGCTVSDSNRYELKAFLPTSGCALETFAYVRSSRDQLQFVDPHGRTGARVTAMPYQTSNAYGQMVNDQRKTIPNSYQIVMATSNIKSGRDGRMTASDFVMGITQRAIMLAQILSMDLDGFVLQSKSRQSGRSGLLNPNEAVAHSVPMYHSLPLGQVDPSKPMNGGLPYPNVHIAPREPYELYQQQGLYNNFPVYIDGMLHYVHGPSP
ncbi:Hypothetical protein, no similarity [Geotrichum candidum]|uniref:Uncharacterized protein n=1 Tax=Geotrichum candidum TaxID=1173061 RepID=A0A0J9XIX8_GEOCN|nr:Hypothetical protein, no similarity [Geotrichum candidum]